MDLHYIEMWLQYFEENPPLKDHLNVCIAQVSQMIVNTNRGRKKPLDIDKFIINYKRGSMPTREQVRRKVDIILQ